MALIRARRIDFAGPGLCAVRLVPSRALGGRGTATARRPAVALEAVLKGHPSLQNRQVAQPERLVFAMELLNVTATEGSAILCASCLLTLPA